MLCDILNFRENMSKVSTFLFQNLGIQSEIFEFDEDEHEEDEENNLELKKKYTTVLILEKMFHCFHFYFHPYQ